MFILCFFKERDLVFLLLLIFFWYFYIEKLINHTIKEDSLNVHLLYIQVVKCCNGKKSSKSNWFHNSGNSLMKINFCLLTITFDYLSSIKPSDLIINTSFNLIHPFFFSISLPTTILSLGVSVQVSCFMRDYIFSFIISALAYKLKNFDNQPSAIYDNT